MGKPGNALKGPERPGHKKAYVSGIHHPHEGFNRRRTYCSRISEIAESSSAVIAAGESATLYMVKTPSKAKSGSMIICWSYCKAAPAESSEV